MFICAVTFISLAFLAGSCMAGLRQCKGGNLCGRGLELSRTGQRAEAGETL